MWSESLQDWVQDNAALILISCCTAMLIWILILLCFCVTYKRPCHICFNYDDIHEWKDRFRINDKNQSPIHIITDCTQIININNSPLLCFSQGHNCIPSEMKIINDGNHVLLCANWYDLKKPSISRGPLEDVFEFFNIRFHWGPNNQEGSEHMLDSTKYAMEMQVFYGKPVCQRLDLTKTIVVVAYFFKVTPVENPYLELIVQNLPFIRLPNESYNLRPFPLSLLMPIFNRNYFTYLGSLTYPPCTECVRWIIQREPLTISNEQIAQFRNLFGCSGKIFSNTRPVQCVNDRDVMFFK